MVVVELVDKAEHLVQAVEDMVARLLPIPVVAVAVVVLVVLSVRALQA
jgi:hypothetical protein